MTNVGEDIYDVFRYSMADLVKEQYKFFENNGNTGSALGIPVGLTDEFKKGDFDMNKTTSGWIVNPYTKEDLYVYGSDVLRFDLDESTKVPLPDLGIKDVIFNPPATVILWENGDKTVVKTMKGDEYNEELGLLHAIVEYKFFNGIKLEKHRFMNKMLNYPQKMRELPCPHCGRINYFDKSFLGVRQCDNCKDSFSVNKVGRTKKVK